MDPAARHISSRDGSARAGLAKHQVQVDRRSAVLLADHQEAHPFRRPDRERGRVVHEVLVSREPVLGVARQSVCRLLLRSDRSGHGDVVLGEWNTDGHAKTEDRVEEAQQAAEEKHEHEGAAAGQTPAATWTKAPGLLAHSSANSTRGRRNNPTEGIVWSGRWKLALTASPRR